MAASMRLIPQYTYGEMRCAYCGERAVYRAQDRRTGKSRHISAWSLRAWAERDGWRRLVNGPTRHRGWHCPGCVAGMTTLPAGPNGHRWAPLQRALGSEGIK